MTQSDNLSEILEKVIQSRTPIESVDFPRPAGLYGIFLAPNCSLGKFAQKCGNLIYFGKAQRSLASRDLGTHFTSGRTGWSTLRRSTGAILKSELSLKSIPRTPKRSATDLRNYKFTTDGEEKLTSWMKRSLEIGFFVPPNFLSGEELYTLEGSILQLVRAPLDLDRRTKHLNLFAPQLDQLREVCRAEARSGGFA